MNDTTSPTDKAQLDKITVVLAALVDEPRQSKVMISDVIAQRTQYAADIKDLKASIDTTRRALDLNAARDRELQNTANNLEAQTKAFSTTNANLRSIAARLEVRDSRSKWDWATLGCAMLVSAGLAGAGAVFFTKQELDTNRFDDAVRLITQDDDAYWCGQADGQIINSQSGSKFCAIHMPNYVEPEPATEGE